MIVVTTPTGTIGRQVADTLLDRGAPVRVIVRDPARLSARIREQAEVVQGSHADADVLAKAFAGADAVFWLVPPNPHADSLEAVYSGFSRAACEAFVTEGVGRVVGVSALGRGTAVAGHAGHVTASLKLDDQIAATGVPYRALVMPSFMDNLLGQAGAIKAQGLFFGTISPGRKLPTAATRDIAAAAVKLLLDDSWTGHGEVPALGPEDLSHDDLARIMTEVLGKSVRYQQIPLADLRAGMLADGRSQAIAQGMADMSDAKDNGLDNGVARTPETSTPTSFRTWCEEVLKPAVEAA
ncbi:NAD(P)H-binding protein [Amycolatopsis acidicola]|uniref:NAD(P)H-binding protein n=1 Tax=Amycolatopsis acidicola TaxID=2596893 RepID=A0A5N0V5G9_9PSEU|nr:NAD(P)H-binding protein [Amycolatopsis acidicola]KAA9159598.1 NAD(P)H-binding protein [Amycolatopsis acidicola]